VVVLPFKFHGLDEEIVVGPDSKGGVGGSLFSLYMWVSGTGGQPHRAIYIHRHHGKFVEGHRCVNFLRVSILHCALLHKI
jgi:hypothetical protein